MKNKHLFRISLAVLSIVIAIAGCKKDPVGSVSGTFTVYDPSSPLVKTPVDSIWVYLIEVPSKSDTIHADVRTAAIDSALTGSDGRYSFTGIPAGNYAIYPDPGKLLYNFEPDNSEKTYTFSITNDLEISLINFSAPIPGSDNGSDQFNIYITAIHRPVGGCFHVWRVSYKNFLGFSWTQKNIYNKGCKGLDTDESTITAYYDEPNEFLVYAWVVPHDNIFDATLDNIYKVNLPGSDSTIRWYIDWETKECYRYH